MKTVDILLATYKPNVVFFKKLLRSLDFQSYDSINIIIRDDSGSDTEFEIVRKLIKENIKKFSYQILRNNTNIGSNRTFEKLTLDSTADYLAYCDQDDIWDENKIEKLVHSIENENSILSYSDLSIIDKDDNLKNKSFQELNKRVKHLYGYKLFPFFLRRNSVTGCTMLIKSDVAKAAVPFLHEIYFHDHWLALFSTSIGKISYVSEPLVKYRIHGGNQIGYSRLKGIECRDDYYSKKLLIEKEMFELLLKEARFNEINKQHINEIINWVDSRIYFFDNTNFKSFFNMSKGLTKDLQLFSLEVFIVISPKIISNYVLRKLSV